MSEEKWIHMPHISTILACPGGDDSSRVCFNSQGAKLDKYVGQSMPAPVNLG